MTTATTDASGEQLLRLYHASIPNFAFILIVSKLGVQGKEKKQGSVASSRHQGILRAV